MIFIISAPNAYAEIMLNTPPMQNDIENIEIQGRSQSLIGEAISASQGIVGQQEILTRPMLRSAEILEMVPGMVVTQHSGTGKANQYFLRGFNLDHGTDFATFIDGMPINMRTHGHGQGYTDLNFIIPESIQTLQYQKGAYYANVGDFSGAGSAEFRTVSAKQPTQLSMTLGEYNYQRYLLKSDIPLSNKSLDYQSINYALEINRYDGPWTDINEDVRKYNLFTKYNRKLAGGNFSLSFMGYDNQWNSADQIPMRAVKSNIIDELGSLDTSLGGTSSRYSVNAQWQNDHFSAAVYAIDYALNLWSNFTYFLDNPSTGDQFEQIDERKIFGGHLHYTNFAQWAGLDVTNTFGTQLRYDDIKDVGLYRTAKRQRLGAIRSDGVEETSVGIFWENNIVWNPYLRTTFGARYDYYDFAVNSRMGVNINGIDLSNNTGNENDANIALKGSLIYTLNENIEAYFSAGQGFHSNDARGTIAQVDPNSGASIAPVDPLVDSFGYELGLRVNVNDNMNISASIWTLRLDSELLFVGDAGNTEPSFASTRRGFEVTSYYRLSDNWTLDFEYALTDAEFSDLPKYENAILGAIESVLQTGVSYQQTQGWFGAARLRYFGERPLIEDNSEVSDSTQLMNVNVGYTFASGIKVKFDILNALDSDDHDIDYFYASRLSSEANDAEVDDLHYHVLEPRSARLTLMYSF